MGKKSKAKRERKKGAQAQKAGEAQSGKPKIDVEVTVARDPSGASSPPPATPMPATTTVTSGSAPQAAPSAPDRPADSPPPRPATTGSSGGGGGGVGAGLHYALLGVLGLGVCIAIYLVRHKLKISLDPDYVSSCNLGGAINCDKVNVSRFSEIAGIPISLFAIPTYLVMAYLTTVAMKVRGAVSQADRDRATVAMQSVAVIGLATVGYSLFLAFVSTVWIRAYCLYCISLYVVNVVATVLAFRGGAGSLSGAVTGAFRALFTVRAPVPVAAAVMLVSAGLALAGYSQAKGGMQEARERMIDAQFAEIAEPEASAAGANATGGTTQVAKAEPVKPKPAPELQSTARGTRGGKKTDDGYTYFAAPLDQAAEFWGGQPDAEVTVVKYADFQCAYCRRLADSMDKVKEKYHDRVRFVMKHFPMNMECNRAMRGFDKHPVACETAYAAHCAGEQGKFWEMHDLMYDNQPTLALDKLPGFAEEVGLDKAAFDACMLSDVTHQEIKDDIESGLYAGIYGTPRTYINNRLVTGSAHAAILEYYIEKAFEELAGEAKGGKEGAAQAASAPRPDGTSMIEATSTNGSFYIDPYEAAITKEGRAVSQPGLTPAQADYFTAQEACEKAGKRLCTEEEWVSACSGTPAIDDNNNKMFADDLVEGDMYPYGPYHEDGRCQDRADDREGTTVATGSMSGCRTASGVFDLAGNIAEWTDAANEKPTLLGGSMASATGAACNRRTFTTPPGSRNRTTGFRCCADGNVSATLAAAGDIAPNLQTVLDLDVPEFKVEDTDGNAVDSSEFKGQVTLVNFFASWCGPCKKEFPHLVGYAEEFEDQGLKVVGVGVDTSPQRSLDFAKGFEVNFPVIADPDARLKGKFIVYEMPATFLVDHDGVVRYRVTGFSGDDQEKEMRGEIEKLLSASVQAKG